MSRLSASSLVTVVACAVLAWVGLVPPAGAQIPPEATPAAAADADTESTVDTEAIYDAAKQLFDEYAPEEVKAEYEFPSHEQWDAFATRLQRALEGGSLEELAAFEPDVRQALSAFRMLPDYGDYADWLAERLDLIETARLAVEANGSTDPKSAGPTPAVPAPTPTPSEDKQTEPTPPEPDAPAALLTPGAVAKLPYYDLWYKRLQKRPVPARADELVPLLKVIFSAEGLPAELAWLAEVESTLNPSARSPKGARGLFQLMPATARALGLSLFPMDERVHPGKNARAAARLLRRLHQRFDSWPLALAAYNAGEGRIAVALKKNDADSFAEIAEVLPVETRMYVPKVFATVSVREKRETLTLPPPREVKDAHTHAPAPRPSRPGAVRAPLVPAGPPILATGF